MKKIISLVLILILGFNTLGTCAVLKTNSSLKPSDYTNLYEIFDEENDVIGIFGLKGPIINRIYNQIDLLSFSIYENSEHPEYLYMKMNVGEVKFTELRSVYNIIWDFNGLLYFTGMHTLNSSETILDYSGFIDSDDVEHKIWNTSVEIDEVNCVFSWTITKDDLGLKAGDILEKPRAQSNFMTKKWNSPFKIRFAIDETESGSSYTIQY